MIKHLTRQDEPRCPALFRTMYEDRKKVFIDMLKWNITHDGRREQDQYDTDLAQYLILQDQQTSEHLGSVRLLPTTRPHMLVDVFPYLCDGDVPRGPEIWEISRLVVSPRLPRRERLTVRNMLGRSMIEFGLLTGIEKYTAVCEMGFLSQLLASGWRCDPLGIPQEVEGSVIGALLIHNDADSLARTKTAWQFESPTLHIKERPKLAA